MNRRGFLGTMLAACAAPAIVRAGSLMPGRGLILPPPLKFHPMALQLNSDGSVSSVLHRLVRENTLYDLCTDSLMARYDIKIGESKYHIDTKVPAGESLESARIRAPIKAMFDAQLKAMGKTWFDVQALPINAGGRLITL